VFLFTPWGTLGTLFLAKSSRASNRSLLRAAGGVSTMCLLALSLVACGGYDGHQIPGNRGTASILVTARSASVTHTTTISITLR
jgi:hypothetical protein